MAKRGETRPWKVTFVWDNGIKGTVSCGSEDEAEMKAAQIRRAGESRDDLDVTVTIKGPEAR